MASGSCFIGKEVPILSNDTVKWLNIRVPSNSIIQQPSSELHTPSINDASSMCTIRDDDGDHHQSTTYFLWRINKTRPNVLEILQFGSFAELPRVGLRIEYNSALCPFASICKNKSENASIKPYMIYTLSVDGVAHLIRLNNFNKYGSCSVFPSSDVVELNMHNYGGGTITALAATTGFLIIGKEDGSFSCFRLGSLDSTSPGFLHELRDGSLFDHASWLVTRIPDTAVKDILCIEIRGRTHVLVLHLHGVLQVWDLLSSTRLYYQFVNGALPEGTTFARLWAGEFNSDVSMLPMALLHKTDPKEVNGEMLCVYALHFCKVGRLNCGIWPSVMGFLVEEAGALVDVKLSSDNIWILKKDGLVMHNLSCPTETGEYMHIIISEHEQYFGLQESIVAEQLLQNSEHAADDVFRLAHSVYASAKEQITTHVSSIFMRMLFLPGIFHNSVLLATFQDFGKNLTNSEFRCLSADGIRKQLISLMEHKGASRSPRALLSCWKNFYSCYLHNWSRENAPFGLLHDPSTGAIGLIRKSSISLLRSLEEIELLSFGSLVGLGERASRSTRLLGDTEREVIFEVFRCTSILSQHLGYGAPGFIYESFLSEPSLEDMVGRLLKVLETGYTSSIRDLHVPEPSIDNSWENKRRDHKTHRKFSVNMVLSLRRLCQKAKTWGNVVAVIKLYLDSLVAQKIDTDSDFERGFDITTCITVQVTSQIAKVMFESAVDILLMLSYMVKIGGQIDMLPDDIFRIQFELLPLLQKIITEWHIIHFLGTTPCESPDMEDSSSRFSPLDGSANQRSWNAKIGKSDFTLAFLLILDNQRLFQGQNGACLGLLPNPSSFSATLRKFSSYIVLGPSESESSSFSTRSTVIALILLKYGQFDAVEHLLTTVNKNLLKEKVSHGLQGVNSEWCTILHLLGCCLIAQAHKEASQTCIQKKLDEAISCFFRAASLHGASNSLENLAYDSGLPHIPVSDHVSPKAWKLHYYQRAMTIFEQYNMSAGACQFALAALEEADEVLGLDNRYTGEDFHYEEPNFVKGRLWSNVFKFCLDLNKYHDAYCAIISNPDEESKHICLRRFIHVLFKHHAVKILCDGSLPFTGLAEKVEQELALKAKNSDVSVKPNPLKILYAFAINRHNWRKAASYMYCYSMQLKSEAAGRSYEFRSFALQERLNCISATINALHLLSPSSAWISTLHLDGNDDFSSEKLVPCMDIERLHNEFVLTSAEHLLFMKNIEWSFTGIERPPSNLIELLVQSDLYDMVFTVILRFYTGSSLKGELERVFSAMSRKCCLRRNDTKKHGLLLASKDEVAPVAQPSKGNDQWDALKQYMAVYKSFHPKLPVIVAETLLSTNSLMKLPLWLVDMFKGTLKETLGMTGSESSPASLFQLYVDHGRYAEATNLVLHYLESFASLQTEDVIRRKKPFAVWFPYTTIARLKCKLEEVINSGQMVAECEEQRNLLETALLRHFQLLQSDSDDVMQMSL